MQIKVMTATLALTLGLSTVADAFFCPDGAAPTATSSVVGLPNGAWRVTVMNHSDQDAPNKHRIVWYLNGKLFWVDNTPTAYFDLCQGCGRLAAYLTDFDRCQEPRYDAYYGGITH